MWEQEAAPLVGTASLYVTYVLYGCDNWDS